MKQFVMLVIVGLLFGACSGTKETRQEQNAPEKMELGWILRTNFETPEYPKFKENYDTARVSDDFIGMIKTLHQGIDIVVIFGTWCGDSKREVPRFLKIADLAGIPPRQIKFYGVDRTKKSKDGVTEHYSVERVPTFIFLKNLTEVGRIVESPRNSMEEDMLTILAGARDK